MITDFRGEHAFLSNFYPSPIRLGDFTYATGEHAYQAQKTTNPTGKAMIASASTPRAAKNLGRSVELRAGWEQIKDRIMTEVVLGKFLQNADLAELLLATGDEMIVEDNTWHDQVWGNCTCPRHADTPGDNLLGVILMSVRAQL